jgi:hypothetical protein
MKTLKEAMQVAKEKRFSRAMELLQTTDLTGDEIALIAGISARSVTTITTVNGIHRIRSHNKSTNNPARILKSQYLNPWRKQKP